MKIVVSDPIFLPGEYRERLENLGELEVYEKNTLINEGVHR